MKPHKFKHEAVLTFLVTVVAVMALLGFDRHAVAAGLFVNLYWIWG